MQLMAEQRLHDPHEHNGILGLAHPDAGTAQPREEDP
jgi:hypothetical protein